jgi:hypothetical protein
MTIEGLEHLPEPPPCHFTSEPFTRCEWTFHQEWRTVRMLPPAAPVGAIYEWDDDAECDVFVRAMTAEERATEEEACAKAYAEWQRTGGVHRVAGPSWTDATFYTASGGVAEAILVGKEWSWTAFKMGELRR